jgi:hyperosmotically inducible protein
MKLGALILCMGMLLSSVAFSAQSAMASEQTTARIEKQVTHELNMLPYGNVFDYVTVSVDPDGAVTLSGEVTQPILKSEAAKAVARVEGVERVDNQIKVLPLSSFDARLRMRLYRSIYGEPALQRYGVGSNASIRIIVDNGHVTLKGVVDNSADRIIAGMQARSVPGSFSVDNQLKVVKG